MPVSPLLDPKSRLLISLDNVSVHRNGSTALDRIDLSICRGEIVTLVGPNGAGKSTLVKTALGLIKPNSGQVAKPDSITIGYVPQTVDIDDTLPISVKRFLTLWRSASDQELMTVLKLVGASGLLQRPLNLISGGEMRRVILARALLVKPDMLILDEPTSGVDINGQASLYALIADIRDRYDCGVLLVSHNLHIVMAATDRVICLNRHLCCSGSPEDVRQHPQFVSLFGQQGADALGIYRHHHDHVHDLSGGVCDEHHS